MRARQTQKAREKVQMGQGRRGTPVTSKKESPSPKVKKKRERRYSSQRRGSAMLGEKREKEERGDRACPAKDGKRAAPNRSVRGERPSSNPGAGRPGERKKKKETQTVTRPANEKKRCWGGGQARAPNRRRQHKEQNERVEPFRS